MCIPVIALSSKFIATLREAANAFEQRNSVRGEAILESKYISREFPLFRYNVYNRVSIQCSTSMYVRENIPLRLGKFDVNDALPLGSFPLETAEVIRYLLTKLCLESPSMHCQGTTFRWWDDDGRGNVVCPATNGKCSKYHRAAPSGKSLVHLLAPNGTYVHAFQHQRKDHEEIDEIGFREPKPEFRMIDPEDFSDKVITAIPIVDYQAYGYKKIGRRWVDPSNEKEKADALSALQPNNDLRTLIVSAAVMGHFAKESCIDFFAE